MHPSHTEPHSLQELRWHWDIFESCLQDGQELLSLNAQEEGIEAGLATHGTEVDELIGVVAHQFSAEMLDGVNRGHLKVCLIGLGKTDVVLDEDIAAGKSLPICDADVRSKDSAVVEVKGLNIHAFTHETQFIGI